MRFKTPRHPSESLARFDTREKGARDTLGSPRHSKPVLCLHRALSESEESISRLELIYDRGVTHIRFGSRWRVSLSMAGFSKG